MEAAAAAAAAPDAGAAAVQERSVAELCISELQAYHKGVQAEAVERRRERLEWDRRLARVDQDLRAEDRTGHDLTRRLAALETAILEEQLLPPQPLAGSRAGDLAAAEGLPTVVDGVEILSDGDPLPTASEALALLLERLPRTRTQSCREQLRTRLRECGLRRSTVLGAAAAEPPGATDDTERRSGAASSGARCPPRVADATDADAGVLTAPWAQQCVLRSHLDGVRDLWCDEQATTLVSCGEDALIKCWDLQSVWRASSCEPPEPYVQFRGHLSTVLALARSEDGLFFSAGADRTVRAWRLPAPSDEGLYESNTHLQQRHCRAGVLVGHRDAVWAVAAHPHLPCLASASADGLVGLWPTQPELLARGQVEMRAAWAMPEPPRREDQVAFDFERPAALAWLPWAPSQIIVGLVSGGAAVFDVTRGRPLASPRLPAGRGLGSSTTSVACHQVEKLVASGHADNSARILDLSSGSYVMALSDHEDAVTSVRWDVVHGYSVVTGSHDGCLRVFDLRTGGCLQRLRLHRPKHEEAVHAVCCGGPRLLATAGADGLVSLLAPAACDR